MLTHLCTDTQIGRQLEVKCLVQGHIDMWQEEAGIEPTPIARRLVLLLTHSRLKVASIAASRSAAMLGVVILVFLLTILHIFSIGFISGQFAGQSSTAYGHRSVGSVWGGAKSCWRMKSASP
ncbi:hypothetical protein CHARACLAT_027711 [Characodon lateralis]|uniref:Uncharacterized protein n=1 Tax=Characodon lateralis TaxID=208331 RepID=A0ABU7F7U7_9TELE|nr:hypothetical protein [Characodon lateralis]